MTIGKTASTLRYQSQALSQSITSPGTKQVKRMRYPLYALLFSFCIPASTEEKKDEEEAIKIEQDEEVEFWYTSKTPSGIMCRVLNDRQVEYEGKPWSLSGLARYLTKAKNCIPGPHYLNTRAIGSTISAPASGCKRLRENCLCHLYLH